MTPTERIKTLRSVKRELVRAHKTIEEEADAMEKLLPTEYDQAMSKEYGTVCRVLGILEEQIANIGNQINQLK